MNKIITLPNGRVFDLEKDNLTTEDYRCLSGVEVRHIRDLQNEFVIQRCVEKQKEYLKKGLFVGFM